jgi:hypothetical protein
LGTQKTNLQNVISGEQCPAAGTLGPEDLLVVKLG